MGWMGLVGVNMSDFYLMRINRATLFRSPGLFSALIPKGLSSAWVTGIYLIRFDSTDFTFT
jgi:hypothetical protein